MKVNQTTPPGKKSGTVTELSASRQEQARAAHQTARDASAAATVKAEARRQGKPVLSADNVIAYIDWVVNQLVANAIAGPEATILLRAAELVISTQHAEAQGKPAAGLEPEPTTP